MEMMGDQEIPPMVEELLESKVNKVFVKPVKANVILEFASKAAVSV